MPRFVKIVSRPFTVLTSGALVTAWNDKERFVRLTGFREYIQNFENVGPDVYFDQDWIEEIEKKYVSCPPSFFYEFCEKGVLHGERLVRFARDLRASTQDKEHLFLVAIELLKNLLVFLPATHPLSLILERRVREILKKKGLSGMELEEMLAILSHPRKANGTVLEERSLDRIRREIAKSKKYNPEHDLSRHAEKFAYLGYRQPFSKGYSLAFFKKRLREEPTQTHHARVAFRFTAKEKQNINLLKEYVFFRTYRTEKLYEAMYYIEPLIKQLSRTFKLNSATDLAHYRVDEVRTLLECGTRVPQREIDQRKLGYGYLLDDNKLTLITGTALQKKMSEHAQGEAHAKELSGMPACRGVVRGLVKIVLSPKDQAKVKTGDILVTAMTTPDFLPCMKRASAFVTDEGGITCHAAIVAREMGKPCIIGTKNATKMLMDGDYIEVNAESGIITLL